MADVREWQSCPLEKSYQILFLDALRINSRLDGKNAEDPLCDPGNQLGRQKRGSGTVACGYRRRLISRWACSPMSKNAGLKTSSLPCMDGLTGFPEAVKAVFHDTYIQHCIVYMRRNSKQVCHINNSFFLDDFHNVFFVYVFPEFRVKVVHRIF